jgi:hypothetical protein
MDDVNPNDIMKKVADSVGAKYSVQAGVANPSLARPEPPKQKLATYSYQQPAGIFHLF